MEKMKEALTISHWSSYILFHSKVSQNRSVHINDRNQKFLEILKAI